MTMIYDISITPQKFYLFLCSQSPTPTCLEITVLISVPIVLVVLCCHTNEIVCSLYSCVSDILRWV